MKQQREQGDISAEEEAERNARIQQAEERMEQMRETVRERRRQIEELGKELEEPVQPE